MGDKKTANVNGLSAPSSRVKNISCLNIEMSALQQGFQEMFTAPSKNQQGGRRRASRRASRRSKKHGKRSLRQRQRSQRRSQRQKQQGGKRRKHGKKTRKHRKSRHSKRQQ